MASRIWFRTMNKKIISFCIVLFSIFVISFASAAEPSVCCEKTTSGLFCQDVQSSECAQGVKQAPTACESTSFCRQGFCYDSIEGTCMDNTPQLVCNSNNGTWSETKPAQCELGCCTLGDQAAFVTLVRCKKLSSFLGLKTNYNQGITDETQCILSVQNTEKGACVFEREFEKTCKLTTRAECTSLSGASTGNSTQEFFAGKLCSAPELGTNCGPTRKTTCLPGKDGVYFIDSCGNPANIYDASKINDEDDYWANIKDITESCNTGKDNANSQSCGNCNYLLGSFCRETSKETAKPAYGEFICADLNCKDTSNGESYKHGESWCVDNDAGERDSSDNSVGSKFYKHLCINGKELVEPCEDFRQKECIEDKITTSLGDFSQAACTPNRWQDCLVQDNKKDCENTDRRDCAWKIGVKLTGSNLSASAENGACLPKNTPGIKFWEGEEAKSICAQGNFQCIVTFEKGLFGGEECKKNCECLDDGWSKQRSELCSALGDCGPKINWVGDKGYKEGFKITEGKVKSKK